MKIYILIACLLQTALAAPQLISFKDGKVGVNFFGYHAEAGLGGGQNGENGGLLGGLHASAGTPWGQNAAAGLGGNVNGRAAGVLYAGAQATPDVGAGAVLGGDTSQGGYSGSEAYANGKVTSRTRTIAAGNTQVSHGGVNSQLPPQPVTENVNSIQKIRPPKKYQSSETYDNSFNNGVAFYTNKTKNIYDIEQEKKPAAPAAIVITKTINKTTFTTPLQQSDAKFHNAPALSLNIDGNDSNDSHYQISSNEFNATPLVTTSSASSALSATPTIIHSSASLSHSSNGDNTNGNLAQGVSSDNNDGTDIIITRDRTKLRTRQHSHHHTHKHHRNHQHPKRINLNRQRQRSKTIVKVVEQQQQQQYQQPASEHQQQYRSTEELFPIETQHQQQIYHQQQRPVRRQLIAPPPVPHDVPALPCDSNKYECKNVHREVRQDVVHGALQIPIGILQSLQQSLGNFGGAPPKSNY